VVGYVADIAPEEAWEMLTKDLTSVLVDVRSIAEWSYVGVPDLNELSKQPLLIEWQLFPENTVNPQFIDKITERIPDLDTPIIFICRSGARSASAAGALSNVGYSRCYNLAGGFEGVHDSNNHRGSVSGWKALGLPWMQS